MGFCQTMAEWHLALWVVPAVAGIALAALGKWLGHRTLTVVACIGLGLPLVQSLLAAVFFLWGPSAGFSSLVQVEWMTERIFLLAFDLDGLGVWAVALAGAVVLSALIYALSAVARFAGRHRFYGLLLMFMASAAVLFTSRSIVATLVGWEGLALSAAFMAGFWESEQSGGRTGMRWLLFQRTSGLLLLLGLIALEVDLQLALVLLVGAAAVRAGQFPFHGWLRDSANSPAPVAALVYGVGSTLAAVYLLARFEQILNPAGYTAELIGLVGLVSIGLGMLAGLQQQRQPAKAIGWLFVIMGGYAFLGFAVGDPVAAILMVTSQCLVLGGMALAIGSLVGPVAQIDALAGAPGGWRSRRAYLALAASGWLAPSVGFVALGRLLGSAIGTAWELPVILSTSLGAAACGWICMRIYLRLRHMATDNTCGQTAAFWIVLAPALLAALAAGLGVLVVALNGLDAAGGWVGVAWSGVACGAVVIGALGSWLLGRKRLAWLSGRLTRTQRFMQRMSETGLGIGELLVQLPILAARAVGVIVWRVVGDVLFDTLIMGTTYRLVEGTGLALRMLQNGRIQRYALVTVIGVLALVITMLR